MEGTALANMTAVLNIWANVTEIVGVLYGAGLFWSAVVLGIMQRFPAARKCLGGAAGLLIYGLTLPSVVNMLVPSLASVSMVGTLLGVIGALTSAIGGLCLFCTPMFIAQRRGTVGPEVSVWNCCALLFPILWIVAMVKSTAPSPTQITNNFENESGINRP